MLKELIATYEEDYEIEVLDRNSIAILLNDSDSVCITRNRDDDEVSITLVANNFESYAMQVWDIKKAWDLIDTLIYMVTGEGV